MTALNVFVASHSKPEGWLVKATARHPDGRKVRTGSMLVSWDMRADVIRYLDSDGLRELEKVVAQECERAARLSLAEAPAEVFAIS